MRTALVFVLAAIALQCKAGSNGSEPPNQGALQQTPAGQIVANLSNRGIAGDSRFTEQSMIALYLYKKKDYSLSCTSATDRKKCEDGLIFKNEKIDSLGFTNEPGYFGFDADFNSYFPTLIADTGYNYPATKPADPPGFPDADVWQCMRITFSGDPNFNKYECGVNAHPIRYFNKNLTTYTLQVYATDGKGYASSYILDYNLFNSLNHPVKDGDRYYAYFAVHFNAMKNATDSEDRFDLAASTWKRPIEPDLISPRIEINVKLLAEGPYDKAGSVYDIPDYSTWYDPFAGCRPTANVGVDTVYYSEFLWQGSEDSTGASASDDEFFEIYNKNNFDVILTGWRFGGVGSGSNEISFPICTTIKANGVLTVGRSTANAFKKLDFQTTGISLSNGGESALTIKDASGNTIHSMTCASNNWNAASSNGGSGLPKRSLRLNAIGTPVNNCTSLVQTSTADTGYDASNINTAYQGTLASDGVVATPGFAGP
ncbi:MAG: lamin tail domain-containing protein [Spirochaetes bacterium]|nr:lamin tail domain-containing protein [Spirochaetota bacterium]